MASPRGWPPAVRTRGWIPVGNRLFRQTPCQQRAADTPRPLCTRQRPSAGRYTHWETPTFSLTHILSHTHSHQAFYLLTQDTPHVHTQRTHLCVPTKPGWTFPTTHTATFHRANTGRAGHSPPKDPSRSPSPLFSSHSSTCFGKGGLQSHKHMGVGGYSPVMPTHSRSILQQLQLLGPISEVLSSQLPIP